MIGAFANAFLITDYPQPRKCGTNQEHMAVSAGLSDGAQQGAISKGLSEAQFAVLYGTEDQCREAVMRWRWPSGFVCPVCGGQDHSLVNHPRALPVHCLSTADILDRRDDFRRDQSAAGHLVSRHVPPHPEQGRDFQPRVGPPAWGHPDHGLEDQAQTDAGDDGARRPRLKRLTGRIEVDDAYLGGERNGGKRGRGSPAKTPIVAAVETTPQGKPIRLKLRRVKGFRRAEMTALATRNFNPASTLVSDGLRRFAGVGNAGCIRQPITTGSGRQAALACDTRPAGRCRCISTCCNFKAPESQAKTSITKSLQRGMIAGRVGITTIPITEGTPAQNRKA